MSGFGPPILNSSIRSWNWPCMSPQTVTGHFSSKTSVRHNKFLALYHARTTGWTFDSSCSTSRAYPSPTSASEHNHAFALCSTNISDILYHKVFVHRSPPAACNSSSYLSSHPGLGLRLALLLAKADGAPAICLCPHPSSNPYSLLN